MNTNKRVIAASATAVAGLFLAGCDNTQTEETPEAPAETTGQMDGGTGGTETDGMGTGEGAEGGMDTGEGAEGGMDTGEGAEGGTDTEG